MKTLAIMLLCLLLAACNFPAAPSAASVEKAIVQTQQVPPTQTFVSQLIEDPGLTPEPTATIRPTTAVPEVTTRSDIATQVARPRPVFEYARIYALAHLANGQFLITLEVPGALSGDYQATLGGEPFRCQILPEYPSRLYCNGPTSFTGQFALLQIREQPDQAVVYEIEIGIPPSPYASRAAAEGGRNRAQGGSDQAAPTPSEEGYPGP